MPGPLFSTLTAIPWSAILKNAPAIVKAANALLSGTKMWKPAPKNMDELTSLKERVAALEIHDREDAEVVKRLAEQVEILSFTARVVAGRIKIAVLLSCAGFLIGMAALVLFLIYRA